MGLEPYVLAPTLLMVVAQRLLKKNCKHCMVEEDIEPLWRPQFGLDKSETFYRGAGCDECNGMGLSGRVGVYEVLAASQRIASAIVGGVEEHEIEKIAIEEGMTTLTENALGLARGGTISLSQVYEISSD